MNAALLEIDSKCVAHARLAAQNGLGFAEVEPVTADLHHLVPAPDQAQQPIATPVTEIAASPGMRAARKLARRRQGSIVPIAEQNRCALDADFSNLPVVYFPVILVTQREGVFRMHRAHRQRYQIVRNMTGSIDGRD